MSPISRHEGNTNTIGNSCQDKKIASPREREEAAEASASYSRGDAKTQERG